MPTYYPLKIYQILTRLLTVSLSNMYSASADTGASFVQRRCKNTTKVWNTQIILHFFVFLLHIARLVHYVSPAGPQYDKERLITILRVQKYYKKKKGAKVLAFTP